ncbi:hypothetical protein BD770DRAFT_471315 [Pilaira anomala]|nr:hypothetical protein BD770DRAFT_471315 [Pilaira anomala]
MYLKSFVGSDMIDVRGVFSAGTCTCVGGGAGNGDERMVTWFFENNQFTDAWIPFDRVNQKKLEYVYRHHEELMELILKQEELLLQEKEVVNHLEIDLDEEDDSVHEFIRYDHHCLYIRLSDSHFEKEITLYPAMLLGSLPDRDILIVRAEMLDNNNKYLDV